jgi:flotillin
VVARLDIEQINGDRDAFRHEVEQCATDDLAGLGMKIWQSGVEEVDDGKHQKDGGNGTQYFYFMRKIKAAEAEQTARRSVAEMQKTGDITVKENESQTRMRNAELEAKAVETESTNNILIAKLRSAQEVEQARAKQLTITAQIECDKATQLREAELLRELNVKNIAQETEKERSHKMAKVTVEAEAMERLAQAKLFAAEQDAKALVAKLKAEADGALAKSIAEAEGIRLKTKAEADGFLAKSEAEAEGIRLKMDAEAEGQEKLKKSLGDSNTLIQREMIKEGTYVKVAEASAQGLRGLNPTIWSMDGGGNADTFKSLAPYLQLVANAVGVKLPDGKKD